MALPIEDYAVLGDTGTCALVGRDGSVDWMCLPRFDSPACFAALLGGPENGRWLLGPIEGATTTRRYAGDSFVLETTHRTESGTVKVTDVMPIGDGRADLVRRVEGIDGVVRMRHEWVVRFGYGKVRPWVTRGSDPNAVPCISAIAGPDMLVLRGARLPKAVDGTHVDEFEIRPGECMEFSTTWIKSHHKIPQVVDCVDRVKQTVDLSEQWARRCTYQGPYADAVVRSLLVLRLLTHGGTGGIVAAATTSLPESFGGERNWDYRFCWLRDASLTLSSLLAAGYHHEARLWRGWLRRAIAGDPADIQIMYAVDGARDLPERELSHLSGYAGSTPVRIGNGAVDQRQSDVLGVMMSALELERLVHPDEMDSSWPLQRLLINQLVDTWQEPDNGIWEIRGPRRDFTHSRLMMWLAFDRAVKAVERHGLKGSVERWRTARDDIRSEVLSRGFNAERNSFVQHYDTDELDASLLIFAFSGFLSGDDPRVLGTIEAVERDLLRDGLVLRYRTQTGVDGLSGDEHPFLACSFWLVTAYAATNQLDKAHELMRRLVGLCNDVGLLSEEYDPIEKRMVGNFPQAFSHLALVEAAIALARAAPDGVLATQISG
ncbi:MAG: glycoside hydrolase family 15 protein [Nocardioidaceae bacterium]